MRHRTQALALRGPAGPLEAILMTPGSPPVAAAVLCHAHPLYGGTMHFKPLFRAARAMVAQGLAALRFNFRGVGQSAGKHDGGSGEQDDARAALDELRALHPQVPLLLCGYSFGAVIAVRLGAHDPRVQAVLAIGFPLRTVPDRSFVGECRKPLAFIQGEQDEFGTGTEMEELMRNLPGASLAVIPGSDHFFTQRLDELEGAVGSWARRLAD